MYCGTFVESEKAFTEYVPVNKFMNIDSGSDPLFYF